MIGATGEQGQRARTDLVHNVKVFQSSVLCLDGGTLMEAASVSVSKQAVNLSELTTPLEEVAGVAGVPAAADRASPGRTQTPSHFGDDDYYSASYVHLAELARPLVQMAGVASWHANGLPAADRASPGRTQTPSHSGDDDDYSASYVHLAELARPLVQMAGVASWHANGLPVAPTQVFSEGDSDSIAVSDMTQT